MNLKLQAIEQRLMTVLAVQQKLVTENTNKAAMDHAARLIRHLLYRYETGLIKGAH